jgi:Phosphoesterase family
VRRTISSDVIDASPVRAPVWSFRSWLKTRGQDHALKQAGTHVGDALGYQFLAHVHAVPVACRQRRADASISGRPMDRSFWVAPAGRYAVKHNPQGYYVGGDDPAACQRDDVPLGSLTAGALVNDLDRGQLPAFSFITPDLCNDTHDCGVDVGDAWLRQWVGLLLDSAVYTAGRTALFVVWDEPTPMPVLVVSPTTPSGTSSTAPFDHYSLLHTTEELLGLPYLGQAATATSMRPAFGL